MTTSTPIEEISDEMLRALLTTEQITPQRYMEEMERRKSVGKKIEDGGPAFPRIERHADGSEHVYFGMSLRAYIATKAMAAIIGRPITDYPDGELPTLADTASDAVAYADALLQALAGEA